MKSRILKTPAILSCLATMLAVGSAKATAINVDQIIFQDVGGTNSPLMSGTVDITLGPASNQLVVLLKNTSDDAAFTDSSAPAAMLLTGFSFQTGLTITGGTATVNPGPPASTAVNFSGTDISAQWGYNNGPNPFNGFGLPGVLPTDSGLSSIQSVGPLRLDGGSTNINGPNFGALSANETQFLSPNQEAVRDTIRFVLNFSTNVSQATINSINSGNFVLAFGSPDTVPDNGSTVALLGLTLVGVEFLRRKISKNSLRLN